MNVAGLAPYCTDWMRRACSLRAALTLPEGVEVEGGYRIEEDQACQGWEAVAQELGKSSAEPSRCAGMPQLLTYGVAQSLADQAQCPLLLWT